MKIFLLSLSYDDVSQMLTIESMDYLELALGQEEVRCSS